MGAPRIGDAVANTFLSAARVLSKIVTVKIATISPLYSAIIAISPVEIVAIRTGSPSEMGTAKIGDAESITPLSRTNPLADVVPGKNTIPGPFYLAVIIINPD